MELSSKILNSKIISRLKRNHVLKSGIYCKVKVLEPTVSEEMITAKLLNHFGKYCDANENLSLKVDTQGFEKKVIEDALELSKIVKGMKMEIPLVNDMEIYENVDWDIVHYINFITQNGFKHINIDAIGTDRITGIVNEVDHIPFR